jgi:hypothetical protein
MARGGRREGGYCTWAWCRNWPGGGRRKGEYFTWAWCRNKGTSMTFISETSVTMREISWGLTSETRKFNAFKIRIFEYSMI